MGTLIECRKRARRRVGNHFGQACQLKVYLRVLAVPSRKELVELVASIVSQSTGYEVLRQVISCDRRTMIRAAGQIGRDDGVDDPASR